MTGTLDLPLYGRVRKSTMTKEQLVELWEDIKARTQPPLYEGQLVTKVSLEPDGMWKVHTEQSAVRAANVMLALGVRGAPRKLGVPGEELAKVVYRVIEPESFRDKHVLVVGGGNSAVESALALADAGCCRSVTISYRKSAFARCRGDNRTRIEAAIQQGRVIARMETEVESVEEEALVLRHGATQQRERFANDAIVVQIGGTPPADLLRSFGIEIVTKYGEA